MEVQISPASLFNASNQNMIRSAAVPSFEPSSKRFKSDLTFQCMVCSGVYDDPNTLYEHMKSKHHELYERSDAEGSAGENGFESDSEHELSDEEYLDLSRLLEPICELRQEDDDNDDEQPNNQNTNFDQQPANIIAQLMLNNAFASGQLSEEQLRLQLQLQMQLQNHLLQLQMNCMKNEKQQPTRSVVKQNKQNLIKPLSLRKCQVF